MRKPEIRLTDDEELRYGAILKHFAKVIPTSVLCRVLNVSEGFIRNRRKPNASSWRKVDSRFRALKTLPNLAPFTDTEQATLTELWEASKLTIRLDPAHVRRMKLIEAYSAQVPAEGLGIVFNLSPGGIQQCQRKLKVQRSAAAGRELLQTFIDAERLPRLAELTEAEAIRLNDWRLEMRQKRSAALERENRLLTALGEQIPNAVFAKVFGVTTSRIVQRRAALGLTRPEGGNAHRNAFIRKDSLELPEWLSAAEHRAIEKARKQVIGEAKEKAAQVTKNAEKRSLAKLNAKKKAAMGKKKQPEMRVCSNPKCRRSWPKTPKFFGRYMRDPDGLSHRCRHCQNMAKLHPKGRKNAKAALPLTGTRRERAKEVLSKIGHLVPVELLAALFNTSDGVIKLMRTEAGCSVESLSAKHVRVYWAHVEECPRLTVLTEDEHTRLARFHKIHRGAFQAELAEGRGTLKTQEALLEQDLSTGGTRVCTGGLCKSKRSWPDKQKYFRITGARNGGGAICHACEGYQWRLANFERRAEAAVKEVAPLLK